MTEKINLESPAFSQGGNIPSKYTCDQEDINPALNIGEVPEKTKSLAMIVDDPDAPRGTFVHWVIWNIPVTNKINEDSVPRNVRQGTNGFKKTKYRGPCPPGGTHRYFFKVYALDKKLDLAEGASKQELKNAMKGNILAQGELMGKYSR